MIFPLVLEAEVSHSHVPPTGAACVLERLRLKTTLELGSFPRPQYRNCVIDTGAFISVVPFPAWQGLDAQIRWLARRDEPTFPTWLRSIGGVSGGRLSARVGRISVRLTTLTAPGRRLQGPPIDLLALFAFNPVPESRVLLGLHGGVSEIGRLVIEPGCTSAHFEM